MGDWCITANVGGGPGKTALRTEGMTRWARRIASSDTRPAIVFSQEIPDDEWLRIWTDADYTVTEGVGTRWKIRSALITRSDLDVTALTEADVPSLRYHGSYVVAARWHRTDGDITLISAHASPQPADPATYGWPTDLTPEPPPRDGGGDPRWPAHRLWDSDLVLATVLQAQESLGPLIVGGDFNESRLDDRLNGHVAYGWGHEYFDRARDGGLIDISVTAAEEEIPTRGVLQLDHVLASASLLLPGTGGPGPHLDELWLVEDPANLSDHAALWVPMPMAVA